MKRVFITLIVTMIVVAAASVRVQAQTRPERTSSAKAYYGYSKPHSKIKSKQKVKAHSPKRSYKGIRVNAKSSRRKYSHS